MIVATPVSMSEQEMGLNGMTKWKWNSVTELIDSSNLHQEAFVDTS